MNIEQLSLVSLIYSSDATAPFSRQDLELLLEQSRTNNAAHGITGALLYRDGRFLQVLEGSLLAVHTLMDRLRSDVRHTNVRVLLEEASPQRQFPDWSMKLEHVNSSDAVEIPGYRRSYESPAVAASADSEGFVEPTSIARALHELMRWFKRPHDA